MFGVLLTALTLLFTLYQEPHGLLLQLIGIPIIGGIHISIMIIGAIGGAYGIFQRDQRALLISYVAMLLVTRFAGSKVEFDLISCLNKRFCRGIVDCIPSFLVMYFELTNGIIRFSMLDTSIRTGEVYVMGEGKIIRQYYQQSGTPL